MKNQAVAIRTTEFFECQVVLFAYVNEVCAPLCLGLLCGHAAFLSLDNSHPGRDWASFAQPWPGRKLFSVPAPKSGIFPRVRTKNPGPASGLLPRQGQRAASTAWTFPSRSHFDSRVAFFGSDRCRVPRGQSEYSSRVGLATPFVKAVRFLPRNAGANHLCGLRHRKSSSGI